MFIEQSKYKDKHSSLETGQWYYYFVGLNMKLCTTLALLLLSTLYFSHGEEMAKQQAAVEQGGKTRGEMLAIETNSELVSSSLMQHNSATPAQCSQDGSMCLTCRSVGMCKDGVLTEVPCRGLYPYCDARTGSCTSERRRCKENEKAMSCPSKGYFPDPQSCRAFHVCEGDPMVSYKFACSSLQIYDHEEKKCTRPSFQVRCTSFACFGKQGRYTSFPSDRSIYTLCADASGTGLFKCLENQEFDETKQKCVPSCSSEDNMADVDDENCRKYYRCVKSGRKIEAVPSLCPGQRVFDPEELKCVPKKPSFKCTHPSTGSALPTATQATTTQVTINQASNNEKELSFGETQETFFRQNPQSDKGTTVHQITNEQGKSASIIGSVYNKEHLPHTPEAAGKEEVPSKPTPESTLLTTVSVLGTKTTPRVLPTSNDNVDAVLSMLSDENPKVDSHSSSKIVVRETGVELKDQLLDKSTINVKTETSTTPLKGATYPVTTEEVKIATSTLPSTKMSLDSHAELSSVQSLVDPDNDKKSETLTNLNRPTTYAPIGKQTYKVITQEIIKTTSADVKSQVTTQAPEMYLSIAEIREIPATIKEINDAFQDNKEGIDSRIPVDKKQVENLPTQTFNTKDSEKKVTHDTTNTKEESHLNIGLQHTTEDPKTAATTPSQLILKLKGSESNVANPK